jgi:hypothetical protein
MSANEGVMENQDTRQRTETELRYLPAQQVGHPSGTLAGVTLCTPEGRELGELAGMVVDPAERRARYMVVSRPGRDRTRRYQLSADTPTVLDAAHKTLCVEADDEDFERFDARAVPEFCDQDLLTALFGRAKLAFTTAEPDLVPAR